MRSAARMQKRQWNITAASAEAGQLAEAFKVSAVTAQVLINRQICSVDDAKTFFWPKLTGLIEPEQMPGISGAVERIQAAIGESENITIYGDYDVDGITSVSILWLLLKLLGANVEYYIPHRVDEGYGLNAEAITKLAENGTNLIITVDCGITACGEADLAKKLGIDLIITDHHLPQDGQLPVAVAIVHPSIDSSYPNPHSAGAMVALKLAWAIVNKCKSTSQTPPKLRQFLLDATTLAAMGTVADIVDLRGENRILVSYGLKALSESKLCGIIALIESAGLTGENIDSYHIAFRLGPMLNAAGRMGHARLAVELLTSDSQMRCMRIADYLKKQNSQRRQCEKKIFKQACEKINDAGLDHPDRKTIVLADESWHSGVTGIVASRIIDKFYRPTILITSNGELCQGSGRSIAGFDIHAAISACSKHLAGFGGHSMAAGIRVNKENIADFAESFEEYARENLVDDDLILKLDIDALGTIGEFGDSVVRELKLLEPFGQGNPSPVFASKGVRLLSPPRRVGARGEHLQMAITDNTGSVRCIGFGMGAMEKKLLESDFFSVAYEPQINSFNGSSNVQFVLTDIRFD